MFLKKKIIKIRESFVNFFSSCFASRKKTFKFTALFIFTILFLVQVSAILINNSFYTNFSDDILQYYSIMVDFVASIKDGSISFFNTNNYFGASFFSDLYYIPLDLFTFITYFLSYLMPTEIAFSITELLKIFAGVMALAYYFHLKHMNNRTIFWMSIFYLVSGGMVSFMAFPAFLSIIFYAPLALIVIHYFFNKKRWMVPLYAFVIIFYNFYLAYMLLAFTAFAFLIEYFKYNKFNFLKLLKEGLLFLGSLLLGVLMASVILLPSITFILEQTYRPTVSFNAWIINIGSFELELFQPNIYIRYLAKIIAEQKAVGFYGFENDYGLEHISLYITVIGFVYMSYIFFSKDKISRVYKYTFLIALIFMIFPLFSYVFSGTFEKPYTRWINLIPLIQVMALAHVFDNHGFEKVKMKYLTITISILLISAGYLLYYYIKMLNINTHYAGRLTLTADTVLIGISIIFLLALLVFGWLKKYTVIKWFLWIEFIIAIGYIYSGPFAISNKIDTFETMHSIDEFLENNLDDDEFYRVYVDTARFDVEKTNYNRMSSFPTNTHIFHSWTDAETNGIGKMIFNSTEAQSKNKMNFFGYYINHFLGYKYILVDNEYDYQFEDEYFSLIAEEGIFSLYEMKYAEDFYVFDTYFYSEDEDEIIRNSLKELNANLLRQQTFIMAAIIDPEKGYDMSSYDLNYLEDPDYGISASISAYNLINGIETIDTGVNDDTEKTYYVYGQEELDVNFYSGALYIKFFTPDLKISDFSADGVFVEFEDGSKQLCRIYDLAPDQSESDSKVQYHIKCEFNNKPVKLFIEKNENLNYAPTFKLRVERAINRAAYLVYDLSSKSEFLNEGGHAIFEMSVSKGLDRLFAEDENGNMYEILDGYINFDTKLDKVYIFKTSQMYKISDLFNTRLRYLYEDEIDHENVISQNHITDKYLSIKNGKINLAYNNIDTTTKDQIIVVPVTYSEEWQFTTAETYDTISVSGGFLGIVIPKGTQEVNLSMKFVPKNIDYGLYISLGATSVYLLIFILPMTIKKIRGSKNEKSKIDSSII